MVMKSQSPLTQVLAPPHSIIPRVGTGAEKESLCRVVPFFLKIYCPSQSWREAGERRLLKIQCQGLRVAGCIHVSCLVPDIYNSSISSGQNSVVCFSE